MGDYDKDHFFMYFDSSQLTRTALFARGLNIDEATLVSNTPAGKSYQRMLLDAEQFGYLREKLSDKFDVGTIGKDRDGHARPIVALEGSNLMIVPDIGRFEDCEKERTFGDAEIARYDIPRIYKGGKPKSRICAIFKTADEVTAKRPVLFCRANLAQRLELV